MKLHYTVLKAQQYKIFKQSSYDRGVAGQIIQYIIE